MGTFKLPEGNYTSVVRVYDGADSWSVSEKENFEVTKIVPKAGKSAESALLSSIEDMASLAQSSNLLIASDSLVAMLDAETNGGRRLLASSQAYRLRVRRLLIKKISQGSVAAEMSPDSAKRTLTSVRKLSSRPAEIDPNALGELSSLLFTGSANTLSDQVRTGGLQTVMSLSHNIILSAEMMLSGGSRHAVVLGVKDSLQNVLDTFARSMTSDEAPLAIVLSSSATAVARNPVESGVYVSPDLQDANFVYEYGRESAKQPSSSRRQAQSQNSGAGLAVLYFSKPWHPVNNSLGVSNVIGVHLIVGPILPVPLPPPMIIHKTRPCATPGCMQVYVAMEVPAEAPLSRQNHTEQQQEQFARGLNCLLWQQGAWLPNGCRFVNATYSPAKNTARVLCACDSNGFVHAAWVPPPPYPLVSNTLILRTRKYYGGIPVLCMSAVGGALALLSCIWFMLIVRLWFHKKYPGIRKTNMHIWAQDMRALHMQRLWGESMRPELRPTDTVPMPMKLDEEPVIPSESDAVTTLGGDSVFWEHQGTASSVRSSRHRVRAAREAPHSLRSLHQQLNNASDGVNGEITSDCVPTLQLQGNRSNPREDTASVSARSIQK